jgi:chromosome segregation ATPase
VSGPATAALERVLLRGYKTNAEKVRAIDDQTEAVRVELEKFEGELKRSVLDLAARSDALRTEVEQLTTEAGALSEELLGGLTSGFEGRWKLFEQRADSAERRAAGLRDEKNRLKADLDDTLAAYDAFLLRNPSIAPVFG